MRSRTAATGLTVGAGVGIAVVDGAALVTAGAARAVAAGSGAGVAAPPHAASRSARRTRGRPTRTVYRGRAAIGASKADLAAGQFDGDRTVVERPPIRAALRRVSPREAAF